MTSFAFIIGVIPQVISSGDRDKMCQAIGVAVFSGMIDVIFFGIILAPVFYALERIAAEVMTRKNCMQKVKLRSSTKFGGEIQLSFPSPNRAYTSQ
ncbi:efflux RND transporter permease subunit [Flexibacterium corallicola]|uniref:efflux RND transporter permease subunit n=1 Tax=Flexibacterium corallicola TaxID=3037259 RepID=UPI00286F7390|nr:efflux RND transporter permease subunit [Pseudovibrio sp. M1P-2-3]